MLTKIKNKIISVVRNRYLILKSHILFNTKLNRNYKYAINELNKKDVSKYEQIMVVAHPDDELIFGGEILFNDKTTLVICLTNNKGRRKKNFSKVMEETNCDYVHLGFTDIYRGKDYKWNKTRKKVLLVLEELKKEITNQKVITHNYEGEYFHIHHILINELMTNLFESYDNLFYFSLKSENKIENIDLYNKKKKLSKIYSTQKNVFELGYIQEYMKKATIVNCKIHIKKT